MSEARVQTAVAERYSDAAREHEVALCCPASYDPRLLSVIPQEVIDRDYGCGDPSRHLLPGETVLDLGSGGGKICFIASQVVGEKGRVIGVDMNEEMLALARGAAPVVAERLGYDNVRFHKARIQDLRLDRDWLDARLAEVPVQNGRDLARLEVELEARRGASPLIPDGSVDVVVSNCVLNLVPGADKPALFREIARVLRRGGRAVISDIVADEDVPLALQADPELWSGCVSGALREDAFLMAFEEAGLHGITVLERDARPWRVVEGIELRSVTVVAWKGKEGPCLERLQAVIYRGPFKQVEDDDHHVYRRGVRTAVCDKTFGLLREGPYAASFDFVEPAVPVPLEEAGPFPCSDGPLMRPARATRGGLFVGAACSAESGCC